MSGQWDKLGDGQKGRLVYQVMGKDGPIYNPRNIKYLPPEEMGLTVMQSGNLPSKLVSNLTLGVAGLNLVATVANIALTAKVLSEVRNLSSQLEEATQRVLARLDVIDDKLDKIAGRLDVLDAKLDAIYGRMKRVDVKVQELHLREVLKYLEQRCVVGDTIDLMTIKKIETDVRHFIEAVGDYGYVRGASFELSFDVRERLHSLGSFLMATREMVAAQHNIRAGGDPQKMLYSHLVADYRPESDVDFQTLSVSLIRSLDNARWEISKTHYWDDSRRERLFGYLEICTEQIREAEKNSIAAKGDEAAWLWKTDMGLIWRLHKELRALGDYSAEFPHWKRIESVPLGTDEILIDCTWDKTLPAVTA